ncbi:MAG: hypothetical protein ACTHMM_13060 [Agriterribacter sp.]
MIFEILCPHNGKEHTLVFKKISHDDGIAMYFGRFKTDATALFNCIKIDNQQAFVTLSENVCPQLQKAVLDSINAFETNGYPQTVAAAVAV